MSDIETSKAKLSFKKTFRGLASLPDRMASFSTKDEIAEARKELEVAMGKLLDTCQTEKREMTDAEAEAYDHAEELFDTLDDRFNALLQKKVEEEKMARPGYVPYTEGGFGAYRAVSSAVATRLGSLSATNKKEWRNMFPGTPVDKGGFADFRDFMASFLSGRFDPRMQERRTQVEGQGSMGGFLVPTEMAAVLLDSALEMEIFRPRCAVYPMQSAILNIPAFKAADHGSLFGGLAVQWVGENQTANLQTAQFRNMEFTAKKGVIYVNASREIISDGINFDRTLREAMRKAIAFGLDNACINGTGVNQPIGVLNCASTVKVNRAAANTVSYSDLVDLYSRMAPAFTQNAIWLVAVDAVPKLMAVTDTWNHLIWSPGMAGSIAEPVPQTLFGRPVIVTEKCPKLGNAGDIMFVDPTQYALGLRQDLILETSNAPYWTSDLTSFRIILRADGASLWDEAIKPANGSANTLSWCVCLDA